MWPTSTDLRTWREPVGQLGHASPFEMRILTRSNGVFVRGSCVTLAKGRWAGNGEAGSMAWRMVAYVVRRLSMRSWGKRWSNIHRIRGVSDGLLRFFSTDCFQSCMGFSIPRSRSSTKDCRTLGSA